MYTRYMPLVVFIVISIAFLTLAEGDVFIGWFTLMLIPFILGRWYQAEKSNDRN